MLWTVVIVSEIYSHPIWFHHQTILVNAHVEDSLVVDGCFVDGTGKHSILSGAQVREHWFCHYEWRYYRAGAKIKRAIIGEGAVISDSVEIDGTDEVQVVGYNEKVGVQQVKIDKYSAILNRSVSTTCQHNKHRPVASLPFGGKYRLIDSTV